MLPDGTTTTEKIGVRDILGLLNENTNPKEEI